MNQNNTIPSKGNRLPAFDILKVFAIFMVLWGHCISGFQSIPASHDSVYRIIYSFHMPLFMMIAGFFSVNSYRLCFKVLIKKKFLELIFPVIVWGVFFFICNSIICLLHNEDIYPIYDLKAIYIKNLWFLKSAFICYITAYFCFRNNNWILLFITLIISQFIIFHNICIMYPSFCMGVILRKNMGLLTNKSLMALSSLIFILMLLNWDESFWVTEGMWPAPNMLKTLTTGDSTYLILYLQKGVYRIIIGIVGSIAFITFFNIYFSHSKNDFIKTVAIWGQFTLGIYISQSYILEYILGSYINMDNTNFFLFHFIITPFISMILLFILTHFVMLTYKNRMLSFLMWGKYQKTQCNSINK